VRLTKVGTPITSSDWDYGELGDDDGGADGSGDFLGSLDTETNVASGVTDDNDGLEAGTLTGTGLLLDRLDLSARVSEVFEYISPSYPMAIASRQFLLIAIVWCALTFITSSLSAGRKKSTIWYSLIGREWR